MQGREQNRARWWAALLLVTAGCGADELPPPGRPAPAAGDAASLVDPATAATVEGQVVWEGDLPAVPPFNYRMDVHRDDLARQGALRANPHAPAIDPATRAVKD